MDLSTYDGQSVYIAFVMTNDDGDDWFIDNLLIEEEAGGGTAGGKLLISEVAYPDNESEGRFIELYNSGDASVDLTSYYLGFYRNTRRINLVGTIDAGETFIYAPNASDFQTTYGFAADQADGGIDAAWFNGTDAIILLYKKNKAAYLRLDTYGVIKADGTGTEWEYLDSHAVRKTSITEDQNPMVADEWIVSSAYATDYFDVTPDIHNQNYYWNGNNNNEWDNYQNWTISGGISCVPDAGANVFVPSGTTYDTDKALWRFPYYFNSLTIQSGANFTVLSGNILKIIEDVSISSSATFNLKSDANGAATFIPEGNISGNTNVERYMATISGTTGNGIWHLFSSPISDLQTNSLMDQYLKSWDEPTASWQYITGTSEIINPGKGYALLLLSAYGNTVNMTGNLTTGDVTSPSLNFTSGAGWEGYNLVGNPYTATIDWEIITPNLASGIDQAIYYWDVENNQYIYYNNGSGTASRYIPAGQAFFIHVTANNQQFTFTEDSRAADSSHIYYKTTPTRPYSNYTPPSRKHHNRLIIESSTFDGKTDKTFLEFHEKATEEFDGEFDAIKLSSGNDEIADIWLSHNSIDYSINTLPNHEINGRYELCINYGKYQVYTLKFDGIESFNENQPINLFDKISQKYYNLRKYDHLDFYNSADIIENRFEIVFTEGVGISEGIESNDWLIFSNDGQLNIRNPFSSIETNTYQIYATDGRFIGEYHFEKEVIDQYFNLSPGIYLIKVISGKQQFIETVWLSK